MLYEMAPMEGITTYIYRNAQAACFGGIDRYFTPFLSPHKDKTLNHKEIQDVLPEHNEGLHVVPQLLTASAEDFLKTAKELAAMGYREVNLNCGCPSATVTTKHKGAGLLADADRLNEFLCEIFDKCPLQISIKTRIGMRSEEEWEELLAVYSRYPIAELIVHPRLREDFYQNTPRLHAMEAAMSQLKCPVTYNGDIFDVEAAERIEARFSGLEACMLGRGLIANPALARQLRSAQAPDKESLRTFLEKIETDYSRVLSGDKNVLYRMKELWFYMNRLFTEPDKYYKKIQKAQKMAVYKSVVDSLFREQELTQAHFIF